MRGFFYIHSMIESEQKKQPIKLVLIALLMMVVLNFPLLSIANQPLLIAGIPLLYWYVFIWWGTIVLLAGIIVHRKFAA
jgi:hypothetical protein